jgi:hypothetical protein
MRVISLERRNETFSEYPKGIKGRVKIAHEKDNKSARRVMKNGQKIPIICGSRN